MEALSTELLDLILAYCSHASQKSLRSVSQRFHALATPLVFSHFYIAPCIFDLGLYRLDRLICCRKKLAKHVRHLTFYADILPPWDRHEFETKAGEDLERCGNAHLRRNDESLTTSAWREFDALRTKQTEWYYDNEHYVRVFKEAISSLPNLTSASVGIAAPFQGSTARWPIWSRLKPEILISPDDWLYDEDSEYQYNDNRMAQTTRATLNLLEAIGFRSTFSGVTQVTGLKIQSLNNGRLKTLLAGHASDDSTLLTFPPAIETRFQTLLAAFPPLTTLDLEIPHPVTETSRNLGDATRDALHALCGREVTSVLTRATNLQRLRLAYDSDSGAFWEPGEEDQHPLYPLFGAGTTPWPRLECLDLSVNLPYTLLLSFLALLSPSLRRMQLRDMCVYDAQALFAQLPKAVTLESVYIECLWTKINVRYANIHAPPTTCILCEGSDVDAPYEQGLKAYLLGRADDFPRLAAKEFLEDGDEADGSG